MADYTEYSNFIRGILSEDIKETGFKNNGSYTRVLENVNKTLGNEYLTCIETEFPEITYEDLKAYITVNDKLGASLKSIFTTNKMKLVYCSPTCLRYIYHALLILKKLRETGAKGVVELGGGYGGLYLALNIFAPKMNVEIEKYFIIDLQPVTELIKKYLAEHMNILTIPLEIYDPESFQPHLQKFYQETNNTFFVSNYALSEFHEHDRNQYVNELVSKSTHGFMVWQTCFGCDIERAKQVIRKSNLIVEEERPQTCPIAEKNYFLYW